MRILPLLAAAACLSAADPAIGVLWTTNSSKADITFGAFAKAMAAKAPQVQIEVKGKLKTLDEAAALYAQWQTSKQAVIFLRSEGATYMRDHPPAVPGFFGVTNDPIELGVLTQATAPEGRLTGCTYAVPASRQVAVWRQLWPQLKVAGLLVEVGHPGAAIDRAGLTAALTAAGVQLHVSEVRGKDDMATGTKTLKDAGAEIIILGTQTKVFDNAAIAAQIAAPIPLVSLSEKPVQGKHALLGLIADDAMLGERLADQVISVVVGGLAVAKVPVAYDPAPRLLVNTGKATALHLTIPPSLAATAIAIE